ncbi:MAG TPA: ATP-binding cassette domain-containing protein, partial [Acidimicrobiales bacterium]
MMTLGDLMADRASAAEVRAYTMRPFLLGEYSRLAAYVQAAKLRMARRESFNQIVGASLGGVGIGVVYLALGLLLYNETMPLAVAGTAVVAVRTATAALSRMGSTINSGYEQGLFYWDFLDFCEEAKRRQERQGGTIPPAEVDRIMVSDVTFTYPAGQEPALRGVSIDIAPGEIIALVGENGSGKTTLAKVIASLYEPETGAVSYGGVPSTEIALQELREQITVVAQNFTHWPFTARQNITVGRHDHPDSESQLAQAAAASGADTVCQRLPQGYDTLLDPSYKGGTELSGGQWQRIAVARGLYR